MDTWSASLSRQNATRDDSGQKEIKEMAVAESAEQLTVKRIRLSWRIFEAAYV